MYIIQRDGERVLPIAFGSMETVSAHLEGCKARCVFLADMYGIEPSGSIVAIWEGVDGARYEVRRLCFISDSAGEHELDRTLSCLTAAKDQKDAIHLTRLFAESATRERH